MLRSSLERKFDKTNFISLKRTPPKSPHLLGLIQIDYVSFIFVYYLYFYLTAKLGMIKEVHILGEEEKKTCLAACDTLLYRILMTNANYPTNSTFEYTKEFCYVVKKLLNSFENRRRVLGKSQPKLIELLDILNKVSIIFYQKDIKIFHLSQN